MTYSDYRKVFRQLRAKPIKLKKYMKFNTPKPRKYGRSTKKCRRCGRPGGYISKYGLGVCRNCFREIATSLGFKKFS
jgi:small subunit ribosomal protein S14